MPSETLRRFEALESRLAALEPASVLAPRPWRQGASGGREGANRRQLFGQHWV